MKLTKKSAVIIGLLLLTLITIPVTLFLQRQPQESRTRAAASASLSFSPPTASTSALQKTVKDVFSLDVMVNPGDNPVSVVRYEILYDASVLSVDGATPFSINTAAFPQVLEGPIYTPGRIAGTVSVGSEFAKAVRVPTRVATMTLKAVASTSGVPTQVTYTTNSQLLSVGSDDQASENVLAGTSPAYIVITGNGTVTVTPTPSSSPSATPTPTSSPSATPTSVPGTGLSLTVFMHGIGNSGDNANPTAHSLSNKNPLRKNRPLEVAVYNASDQLVASTSGILSYNSANGNFTTTIDLGNTLATDVYTVKIKSPQYLRRLIPGIHTIKKGQTVSMPTVTFVTGDVNNDNLLNILDYNIIIGCYSDFAPAVSCTNQQKLASDLTDDGKVNQYDYNLYLRDISVQNGD